MSFPSYSRVMAVSGCVLLSFFVLCLFWEEKKGFILLDTAKLFPLSWRTILFKVFICLFWLFIDVIPRYARKTLLDETIMACLIIKKKV